MDIKEFGQAKGPECAHFRRQFGNKQSNGQPAPIDGGGICLSAAPGTFEGNV